MSKTIQIELPEGVSEEDVKIEFVSKEKPKPTLWVPDASDKYYFIDSDGKSVGTTILGTEKQRRRAATYNAYPSRKLVDKAADYLAPLRMLVRTALEIDPDFEPDWTDSEQEKFYLYRLRGEYGVTSTRFFKSDYSTPVVSTRKKAEQWLELVKAEEAER